MTAAEFDTQFNRLTGHFHLPTDGHRDTISFDWYQAVKHYHVDALERGVTDLTRTAQDRFWPPLGRLTSAIKNRLAGMDRHPGKCATCHGAGWIDSAPFMSNRMIYANVLQRCPDCGIPAPAYTEPSNRQPLAAQAYRDWMNGDAPMNYMPEGQQGKPWDDDAKAAHKAQMLAAFTHLRLTLFGSSQEGV